MRHVFKFEYRTWELSLGNPLGDLNGAVYLAVMREVIVFETSFLPRFEIGSAR